MANSPLDKFQNEFCQQLLMPQLDQSSLEFMAQFKQQFPTGDALTEAKVRLDIYRNNVIHSLSCAISDLYPVVKRLIGDEFFNQLAVEFVRAHPPQHSALVFYGQQFIEFVKQHSACQSLPYLSDVAKLEYLNHQAFNAVDVDPLAPSLLASVAAEKLANIVFDCDPAVQLMTSNWPVEHIWRENLTSQPLLIDLSVASGCCLLFYRADYAVKIVDLNPHCFNFLQQLTAGETIGAAWHNTCQQADSLLEPLNADELSPMLSYLLTLPLFNHLSVKDD